MIKLTENELRENLVTWRSQRAIDENSTADAQINCYLEEFNEFKDAIGDMVVCLINSQALCTDSNEDKELKAWCELQIRNIEIMACKFGVEVGECYSMVWDIIKNRVGLTRKTGKWTKWKDLTHEERLIVARSGQFKDKPAFVFEDAQKHCTKEEWDEILIAVNC